MKKALSLIPCILAMLCFGFIAVAMQITAPVAPVRAYNAEYAAYKTAVPNDAPSYELPELDIDNITAVPDYAPTVDDNTFDLDSYLVCENADENHTHTADCYNLHSAVPDDVEQPELTAEEYLASQGIALYAEDTTEDVDLVPIEEVDGSEEGLDEEVICEHEYGEDILTKEADFDAMTDGYTYKVCVKEDCGHEEVIDVIHVGYYADGTCAGCEAEDTDVDHWVVETTPFNEYLLGLLPFGLGDKITGVWRVVVEVVAIMTFAIAAFILGLIIKAGSKKADKAPKAPKEKKNRKSKKSAAEAPATTHTPRVRW